MNRRNSIRLLGLGSGALLSMPLVSSFLTSCKQHTSVNYFEPENFTPEDLLLLTALIDTILPEGDSPSGSAAGVPQQLDHMISGVYTSEQQEEFMRHFSELKTYLNSSESGAFNDLATDKRKALIQELIKNKDLSIVARKAILTIKNQSIRYYLNTENIAKTYMNYLPVPGPFVPCISIDELNGKAWAI